MKKPEIKIPMLAMRGLVVFPSVVLHFDVSREKSVRALKEAFDGDKLIFLTAQKDNAVETPSVIDIYQIGVVAQIRQILKTPDNVTRVLVEGLYRAKLLRIAQEEPYLMGIVREFPIPASSKYDFLELDAVMRAIKEAFDGFCRNMPKMPKELIASIMNEEDPKRLFNAIVFNFAMHVEDKQLLLEENNIVSKLGMLLAILSREAEVLDIERSIQNKVRQQLDKNQRDYYLREQIKVLSGQLGEDENAMDEIDEYYEKIEAMNLDAPIAEKLFKETERLAKMHASSQEAYVIRNYLDTALELPWNVFSKEKIDLEKVRTILDKDHYGLQKVKERILETIAVRALQPDVKGQIICLAGPPGIGKTSVGKSIAKALGREYVRVSLGGVRDEADIRGHRKTYIGAMPGRIITAMKQAGTKNPVILLDEIDKMSHDLRGDPSSALLEALDSEQNSAFRDHYLEVPFDLSRVLFITTANNTGSIDPPLLDRMEVIELTSYTREEKKNIAVRHLIPKQIKANGLKASMLKIADSAVYMLTDNYTKEAGVRSLERRIASLCRKSAKLIVQGEKKKISVTSKNLEEFLGPKKYLGDDFSDRDEVGVVNGLAWTSVGGVIMPLEVMVLDGKGNVEITGSLGDVMKESAKIAVSYARSVASGYNIQSDFYKEKDIHIHAPEGATPKDGPSAGVTMVTALISALSGIPVRCDIAMTGEITLRGKVLPIGGLREKTMAAYKEGMKTVIIPKANKGDLEEVDEAVKEGLNFIFAETLSDVLDVALVAIGGAYKPPLMPTPIDAISPGSVEQLHS